MRGGGPHGAKAYPIEIDHGEINRHGSCIGSSSRAQPTHNSTALFRIHNLNQVYGATE